MLKKSRICVVGNLSIGMYTKAKVLYHRSTPLPMLCPNHKLVSSPVWSNPIRAHNSNQIKYKAAPIAAAPHMGAAVIITPPAFEDVVAVAELAAFDAALRTLLSAAAATLLMLLISLTRLLFADPVAVAATEERLEMALDASLFAAEMALFARLVPVEIAPPA